MSSKLTLALAALVTAGVGALTFAGGPAPVPLSLVELTSAQTGLPPEEGLPGDEDEADRVFVQYRYRNYGYAGFRFGYRYYGARFTAYRYAGGYRYSAFRYGGYPYRGYRYSAAYYGYRYGGYRYGAYRYAGYNSFIP